jgi:hypothetical protein
MDAEDFVGLAGITATDSAIEYSQNQITFENFVVQASSANILKSKLPPFNNAPNYDYNVLYDCLVSIGAIKKKFDMWTIWRGSRKHTVSTEPSIINNIERLLINKNSKKFAYLMQKYTCNFPRLNQLLHSYKYSATDQFTAINPIGGRKKQTKHRINKRRRHKTIKQIKR